jgi:hypothetical protein
VTKHGVTPRLILKQQMGNITVIDVITPNQINIAEGQFRAALDLVDI